MPKGSLIPKLKLLSSKIDVVFGQPIYYPKTASRKEITLDVQKRMNDLIIIPAGTELNAGPTEDSDTYGDLDESTRAIAVGEEKDGALPIRLISPNGKVEDRIKYFHQPRK